MYTSLRALGAVPVPVFTSLICNVTASRRPRASSAFPTRSSTSARSRKHSDTNCAGNGAGEQGISWRHGCQTRGSARTESSNEYKYSIWSHAVLNSFRAFSYSPYFA